MKKSKNKTPVYKGKIQQQKQNEENNEIERAKQIALDIGLQANLGHWMQELYIRPGKNNQRLWQEQRTCILQVLQNRRISLSKLRKITRWRSRVQRKDLCSW